MNGRILAAMPLETSVALRRLAGYHEESAGGLMTTDYLALTAEHTVAQAIEKYGIDPDRPDPVTL